MRPRITVARYLTQGAAVCLDVGLGAASAAAGTYTPLSTFSGSTDGATPQNGLVQDTAGNLYGENIAGGDLCAFNPSGNEGCGVVFKIDPSGHETTLATFNGTNGALGSSQLLSQVTV